MIPDGFKNLEIKQKARKEHFCWITKFLKPKLNSSNVVTRINSRALAVIKYSAGLIKQTKAELQSIERKTQKAMIMQRALHPQADVDRL